MSGLGVFPVKIRLFGAEEMQIVFLRVLVPFPYATEEIADPVVGRLAFAIDISCGPPDVPVALWVVF